MADEYTLIGSVDAVGDGPIEPETSTDYARLEQMMRIAGHLRAAGRLAPAASTDARQRIWARLQRELDSAEPSETTRSSAT